MWCGQSVGHLNAVSQTETRGGGEICLSAVCALKCIFYILFIKTAACAFRRLLRNINFPYKPRVRCLT